MAELDTDFETLLAEINFTVERGMIEEEKIEEKPEERTEEQKPEEKPEERTEEQKRPKYPGLQYFKCKRCRNMERAINELHMGCVRNFLEFTEPKEHFLRMAAEVGNKPIVDLLVESKFPIPEYICTYAAAGKNCKILQMFYGMGYKIDKWTLSVSMKDVSTGCYRFLMSEKCEKPISFHTAMRKQIYNSVCEIDNSINSESIEKISRLLFSWTY